MRALQIPDWRSILHYYSLPPLLSSGDSAITVFVSKISLGQTDQDVTTLWNLPEAKRIASKQLPHGLLEVSRWQSKPPLSGKR